MAIAPKSGARGSLVPVISAATGMVGYPVYSGPGTVNVKALYNPTVQFLLRSADLADWPADRARHHKLGVPWVKKRAA